MPYRFYLQFVPSKIIVWFTIYIIHTADYSKSKVMKSSDLTFYKIKFTQFFFSANLGWIKILVWVIFLQFVFGAIVSFVIFEILNDNSYFVQANLWNFEEFFESLNFWFCLISEFFALSVSTRSRPEFSRFY